MSKKIGITGGIGSGKTTVCKIFETLGIPVYYADDRARKLMVENVRLIQSIKELFGSNAYTAEGTLNRPHIAKIAFSSPYRLRQLNALVHPAVAKDAEKWHSEQTNVPYTLKEAALLFESGSFRSLDQLICVYAPQKERIKRVMLRDNSLEQQVFARLKQQMSDFEKIQLSDFVITNNHQASLIQQVLNIHQQLVDNIQIR